MIGHLDAEIKLVAGILIGLRDGRSSPGDTTFAFVTVVVGSVLVELIIEFMIGSRQLGIAFSWAY